MAENSAIEWTDHTFNPWEGCQKLGPGCDHCFAEARNARFSGGVAANWGPGAPRRRTSDANWRKPLHWQAEAARTGIRPRVFCASLADVFDNAVHPDWRSDLFELIHRTPDLDWLLLTKRIGNVARMIWADGEMTALPANVWLGATIINQEEADRDIPKLLAVPAKVRFLSMEPLLAPVDLGRICIVPQVKGAARAGIHIDALRGRYVESGMAYIGDWDVNGLYPDDASTLSLDWVIVGGESGPGARPMQPNWARSLRDQCAAAGVPFLFKQWGAWAPLPSARDADQLYLTTKKAAGRLLDGVQHDGMPA
ncbi:phage Gp37/Gp68 family protein [soil metagenome]